MSIYAAHPAAHPAAADKWGLVASWHPACETARVSRSADLPGALAWRPAAWFRDQAVGAWRTTWTATRLFVDDQGLSWAGAIGLYLFLSVPPFMVAVTWAAAPLFGTDGAEAFVVEQVAKYLPAEQDLLEGVVSAAPGDAVAALVSIGLLLFSGSRAFAAMTSAINVLWRRVDQLTFPGRQLLRLGMLAVTVVLLIGAALGEAAIGVLADGGGTDNDGTWLLDWHILPTALLTAFLVAAYKLLPREPVTWRHAALGAFAAAVGIRLAQAGLGVMAEAGTFETPYGHLAGVALMATWALVVGVVVLWCAALVAALEGKRPSEADDERRFVRRRRR
jgi:membrane protein